jgi:hypothetical protein
MGAIVNNLNRSLLIGIVLLTITTSSALANDLVHEFGSPSFSGIGQSQHFLSIEQLQHQRKEKIRTDKLAEERRIAREEENETINKFINNVESRIYAQISKQMVDGMFEENGALTGTADLDGATIYWLKDLTSNTITVQITEEDGTFTEITVPLDGFGF